MRKNFAIFFFFFWGGGGGGGREGWGWGGWGGGGDDKNPEIMLINMFSLTFGDFSFKNESWNAKIY